MARKLAALVLGLSVIAMILLAIRQREVEIAREAARAHWRLSEQRRAQAALQTRLDQATTPDRIRERMEVTDAKTAGTRWGS